MKLDTNNHSVFLLYYHLVLVIKYRREVINKDISNRLKEIDSTSLQMALRNLDTDLKNFFEGRADRPKFKSKKDNYKSYTSNFVNNNIEINKGKIKLPKLKWIKAKIHKYVEGRIVNSFC